jgi:hypothetical protein
MPGGQKTNSGVTPASEWQVTTYEGELVELPSGRVVRLRKTYGLIEMMRTGAIPNPLRGHVDKMLSNSTGGAVNLSSDDLDQESTVQLVDMMTSQMPEIFIEPRVVIPPSSQEEIDAQIERGEQVPSTNALTWQPPRHNEADQVINVYWIPTDDLVHAFAFGQGAVKALATFRDGATDVADVVHEPEVPLPSKSASLDR